MGLTTEIIGVPRARYAPLLLRLFSMPWLQIFVLIPRIKADEPERPANPDSMLRAKIEAAHAQAAAPTETDALPTGDVAIRAVLYANAAVVAALVRVKHFPDEEGTEPLRPTEDRHDLCEEAAGLLTRRQAHNLLHDLRDCGIDRQEQLFHRWLIVLDDEVGGHGE